MEQALDFKVILYLIKKNIVWVVLAAIFGVMCGFLLSKYMLQEEYTSSAQIYISNTQGVDSKIDAGDISAARSMAITYCIILQSDKAKALLKDELSQNETYINSKYKSSYKYSVSIKDESEVLRITVTSGEPELSAAVCNEMIEVSQTLIGEIFVDSARSHSLGSAKPNYNPTAPNTEANMLTGGVIGLALASVLFVLFALLDNRVKDEADFTTKVKIPVLGEVPSIHDNTELKDGYYYAYSKKQDD